jgi:Na+-driven multidrug efflux pump
MAAITSQATSQYPFAATDTAPLCQAGAVWMAGILLMAAVFMIGIEIGMRRLVGASLRGAHEMSGGFFMETLSLMVITIPVVAPVVFALGFDPVWFGILLILLIEMALITPPVGLNLYVVQSARGRGSLNEVMVGAIPFA